MQTSRIPPKTLAAVLLAFLFWQNNSAQAAPPSPLNKDTNELVAVSAPRPEYPYEARRSKITGSGIVAITIDVVTGAVADAVMLQSIGNPILDNAAVSALRRWKFKRGIAISKAWIEITYTMTGASYHLLS